MFPTCVGMNRKIPCFYNDISGVPHVCGDEPINEAGAAKRIACSPRVWG